jgi:hypothetical protein
MNGKHQLLFHADDIIILGENVSAIKRDRLC